MTKIGRPLGIRQDQYLQTQQCGGCDKTFCMGVMQLIRNFKSGRAVLMCGPCTKEVVKNGKF